MGVIVKAVLVLMFQLPDGHLKTWSVSIEPHPKYSASAMCKKAADAFMTGKMLPPGAFQLEPTDVHMLNRGSFCIDFRPGGTDS
jgi:hypothetical protein